MQNTPSFPCPYRRSRAGGNPRTPTLSACKPSAHGELRVYPEHAEGKGHSEERSDEESQAPVTPSTPVRHSREVGSPGLGVFLTCTEEPDLPAKSSQYGTLRPNTLDKIKNLHDELLSGGSW